MTTFLAAVAAAAAATPLLATLARRWNVLDRPLPGVKEHAAPTPYLGGAAVALGVAAGALAAPGALGTPFAADDAGRAATVLLAALVVFAIGLVDDLRPMGPGPKFAALTAATALLVFGGVRLKIEALPTAVNVALTFFWVLAATNGLNIIDVMDGLCAGVAAVAALAFAAVLGASGDAPGAAVALGLAGACLGFLPWNRHPARIFLGDAGALPIGFLLAGVAVLGSYTTWNDVAFLAPVVILGVPLFDTFLVASLRLLAGRSPFRGSKDHLALRLRAAGLSVGAAAAVLWAATAALSLVALAITRAVIEEAFALYTLIAMAAVFTAIWAARSAGAESARAPLRPPTAGVEVDEDGEEA